jgi:hypothetical protein
MVLLSLHQCHVDTSSPCGVVVARAIVAARDASMEGQQVEELKHGQDDDESLHHFLQQEFGVRRVSRTITNDQINKPMCKSLQRSIVQ